ncbi:MAG TPA: RNA-binding cell elongation regulator Jag/EloR [Acidimicrobiales bacterium]|nr:RNA-binding cell elongation regulator Jag/EloR [Acidimicrobiales bacterium]
MEWVEVAAKTVEEATESALDQLGVAVGDAEVIVLAEPKAGLFGRTRGEARVRARVRPVGPRPKRERRPRDRDRGGSRNQGSGNAQRQGAPKPDGRATADGEVSSPGGGSGERTGTGTSRSARRRRNRSQAAAGGSGPALAENGQSPSTTSSRSAEKNQQRSTEPKETVAMAEGMTLEEQGEVGRAFLAGLLSEYGMQATVETRLIDEETVEIAARGDELGLLVGPRGSTLSALQDITRAVVQRQCPSRTDRILVDVAGYREKRSAALKRFSTQIAEEVIASGQEKALESMSPADRKAVHDAVNEIDGVATRSEGEDPNRYIVIAPTG